MKPIPAQAWAAGVRGTVSPGLARLLREPETLESALAEATAAIPDVRAARDRLREALRFGDCHEATIEAEALLTRALGEDAAP